VRSAATSGLDAVAGVDGQVSNNWASGRAREGRDRPTRIVRLGVPPRCIVVISAYRPVAAASLRRWKTAREHLRTDVRGAKVVVVIRRRLATRDMLR
jgi:hypothetical protein